MVKKLLFTFLFLSYSPLFSVADGDNPSTRFLWQSTLCESVFKQHVRLLKNTRIEHKPLIVCFSGTPGMGIPEIAKIVEDKFAGVRISNDEIRTIMKNFASPLGAQWLMQAYLMYFLLSYSAPNKLMILDSSIDRRYTVLLPYLKVKGIPSILVRIETPYEQVVQTLSEREQAGDGVYLKFLDSWYADYDTCGQCCPATIVVKNNKNTSLVLDKLFALIERHLA